MRRLFQMEAGDDVDVTTSLRSELAALQYKRDRLSSELEDMRSQGRTRDQRCLELQVETDQLREQAARQNAIISSLKKRIHELEERERNLYAAQGRNEIALQALQRDVRYLKKLVDFSTRCCQLMKEMHDLHNTFLTD